MSAGALLSPPSPSNADVDLKVVLHSEDATISAGAPSSLPSPPDASMDLKDIPSSSLSPPDADMGFKVALHSKEPPRRSDGGSDGLCDARPSKAKDVRWDEPLKFLPVGFVVSNMLTLYLIYMIFYAVPMMRSEGSARIFQIYFFNFLAIMMAVCYLRAVYTHPGTLPSREVDASWEFPKDERPGQPSIGASLVEAKRSGDRRHCKWCAKYKPDRCHHCRVCRTCILKMDHHCPWIYNCVGFGNHKYFYLFIFYSSAATQFLFWTMLGTTRLSVGPDTGFYTMFFLLFGQTLGGLITFLVSAFLCFHTWLMLSAMTTIEFCEKYVKKGHYDAMLYHRGCLGNMKAVLGDRPELWLLPLNPPSGDGLHFQTEESRLAQDLEIGRGLRKRMHVRSYTGTASPEQQQQHTAGTGAAPDSTGISDDSDQDSTIAGQDGTGHAGRH